MGTSCLMRVCAAIGVVSLPSAALGEYYLQRIASGLSQPTALVQAPGDPANILYITERISAFPGSGGGFNTTNQMGKIWRYDTDTRTRTLVLDLSHRQTVQDTGLVSIAFHPDYNVPGMPGYQKIYVSSAERGTGGSGPLNRVEEYTINPASFAAGAGRTILQYTSAGSAQNHTLDFISFDPTATGAARNYLYIATGDGTFGQAQRPSQDATSVQGKLLRVDVSGDDYLSNPNKNFAIPASNPIPAYNAANPGSPINGLGEVFATGLRNPYKGSFDLLTGDFYYGDVGENTQEEINFLKKGTNPAGPPADFGWPAREGTINGLSTYSPFPMTNPITGATSINPIRVHEHNTGFAAAIGGFVYRGPIPELYGKYLYADFVSGKIFALDFDPNTDPSLFNGANGTVTEMTIAFRVRSRDLLDGEYNSTVPTYGVSHPVSFGQDNEGNIYIIDFGGVFGDTSFGTNGQYPHAGTGEIFKLTLGSFIPEPGSLALLGIGSLLLLRRRGK